MFYADDGRILTPPEELRPLLGEAFPAFSKVLGHIRFFYMVDEIWDGVSSLAFLAGGERRVAVALDAGAFRVHVADQSFEMTGEALPETVFEAINRAVPPGWHRPREQLTVDPDPSIYPCGYRCDLCLGSKKHGENFGYMNWVCYHGCVPGVDVKRFDGAFECPGCTLNNNRFCRSFTCSRERGYANCAECGEYHSCGIYSGSHYAAQCNLGITAEEVTKLVIPYCMKERLDIFSGRTKAV